MDALHSAGADGCLGRGESTRQVGHSSTPPPHPLLAGRPESLNECGGAGATSWGALLCYANAGLEVLRLELHPIPEG